MKVAALLTCCAQLGIRVSRDWPCHSFQAIANDLHKSSLGGSDGQRDGREKATTGGMTEKTVIVVVKRLVSNAYLTPSKKPDSWGRSPVESGRTLLGEVGPVGPGPGQHGAEIWHDRT